MKGMILAAGKGTRVRPITQQIPKPMIPILGKPVMESMIELFAQHNIRKIVINTSHLAEVIEGYFGDGHHFDVQLSYSCEGALEDGVFQSKALGSAGGMKRIQEFSGFFDETFVVVCGDAWIDLDLKEAVKKHRKNGGIATIITKRVHADDVEKYGVVVTGPKGLVQSFQEKPVKEDALSDQVNTGIYIFEPAIFDYIPKETEFDIGSELFPKLVEQHVPFHAVEMNFQWLDVGNIKDIWGVTEDVLSGKVPGYRIPGTQVKAGIWLGINTNIDLSKCNIVPPVVIGSGCLIEEGATIIGPALIGANCHVKRDSTVKHSLIFDYTQIHQGVDIKEQTIFGDFSIGHDGQTESLAMWTNLRPYPAMNRLTDAINTM
ncbi:mannose-1-phosphate guanyltransferase [Vibrio sp. 10N.286.49.C2]|uniref:sugar phosphate nucleotidyltransferase n=1 Tax=unclassified Vibrio TaxID=2614977 RepID=UPI000C86483C|nr:MULTISPECIES: NDP-sugar synthase [unclassified Vibrio]PMH31543.1 mannose-1-phosphate guanyltransferase [Vibrio sp. 10N.286.49.C2]PMH50564.1 mannose-1-phosphate guanyltransferase [Vibrio sp. 10N.286.49.B1]PMH77955.1 mannose-1-phosphate guanyltransferase [Vibrio sp. 10N.286.48.B7]